MSNLHVEESPTEITVLICTHNPSSQALSRTLAALARQSLAPERWELFLIDNGSEPPLRNTHPVDWHPRGRLLTEGRLGKTHALRLGLRHAGGALIVIVDDDNLLAADYLEQAVAFMRGRPQVGIVGGLISPEFAAPPPSWVNPYLHFLAVVDLGLDILVFTEPVRVGYLPPGAGAVVRCEVMSYYFDVIGRSTLRQTLDPVGDNLSRAGDSDMALCAYDLGLTVAYVPALRLTHILPAHRLGLDYLAKLAEESVYSRALLDFLRDAQHPNGWQRLRHRLGDFKAGIKHLFHRREVRTLDASCRRGARRARALCQRLPAMNSAVSSLAPTSKIPVN